MENKNWKLANTYNIASDKQMISWMKDYENIFYFLFSKACIYKFTILALEKMERRIDKLIDFRNLQKFALVSHQTFSPTLSSVCMLGTGFFSRQQSRFLSVLE